jgi:hypothetical protein
MPTLTPVQDGFLEFVKLYKPVNDDGNYDILYDFAHSAFFAGAMTIMAIIQTDDDDMKKAYAARDELSQLMAELSTENALKKAKTQ